ncbi:hypothetical protein GOP47_0016956 [Adiantum capillus-veneris]|uniref:Uncharacterized protein n=1 Tax=Adiantum capillus-veneris TaxID=13818 RepID=A0A9D4UJL8_ADICA|nr:hypothetical protein GOP47_0016956 [Adiantum capillus-veneris]
MNQLKGGILEELGALTSLTSLYLHHNNFMGAIPRNLSNCTSLIIIELGLNELLGSIPTELGELAQLQRLRLWKNNLNGIIPESLGSCKELVILELAYNQLSGNIPWDTLFNCSLLCKLDMSYNQLVGRLSSKLGRLLYLQHLHMEYNLLQGPILDLVLGLSNLQTMDLSFNHLNGTLPKNLANVFGNVVSLKVSHNLLSGNFPPWFGQLMMVEEIDLSHNRFVGTIPENLCDSVSLKYLNLCPTQTCSESDNAVWQKNAETNRLQRVSGDEGAQIHSPINKRRGSSGLGASNSTSSLDNRTQVVQEVAENASLYDEPGSRVHKQAVQLARSCLHLKERALKQPDCLVGTIENLVPGITKVDATAIAACFLSKPESCDASSLDTSGGVRWISQSFVDRLRL